MKSLKKKKKKKITTKTNTLHLLRIIYAYSSKILV